MNKNFIISVTGKRKTAIARIFLFTNGHRKFCVNGIDTKSYFKKLIDIIDKPFFIIKNNNFNLKCIVKGGGVSSQASAIQQGISKALNIFNINYHSILKSNSLLTRDSRIVERKKYGRHKARKKFQFSKR